MRLRPSVLLLGLGLALASFSPAPPGSTSDRPTVERKIAHFVQRPWGGRKARVRSRARVATEFGLRKDGADLKLFGQRH